MGWQLAGLDLETGSKRLDLPQPTAESRQHAEAAARRIADADGVRFVDTTTAREILASAETQSVYAIDVRGGEEFATGHIDGFSWAPGGQAVQATDNFVAIRSGALLFACDGIVRAAMTASWFRQMGFPNVNVLDGGTAAWQAAGGRLEAGPPDAAPFGIDAVRAQVAWLAPSQLNSRLGNGDVTVLHVGASDEFSREHILGSRWLSRSWLEPRIAELLPSRSTAVALTCADGVNSGFAAATLSKLGYEDVVALDGGVAAWIGAGLATESGLTAVTEPPNDVLPVRRSYAEMLNYLRWEEELGEKYAKADRG